MIMVPPVELRFIIYCLGDMNSTGSINKLYEQLYIFFDLGNMEVPLTYYIMPFLCVSNVLSLVGRLKIQTKYANLE